MIKQIFYLSFPTLLLLSLNSAAGVTNPDISAIGQLNCLYVNNDAETNSRKPILKLGEAELVLDAALNPYLNGSFVFAIGNDGFDIEEAYASVVRGLSLDIGLKGGKYRIGFGRLNTTHPHAYPFIRTPRILDPDIALLLPGKESFNDIGLQASTLIPVSGSYAMLIAADVLQGDSFHPDTSTNDYGWIVRIVNSFVIVDQVPTEFGISCTHGTNDPVNKTKSLVGGVDFKTKITVSSTVNLTVQSEFICKYATHKDSLRTVSHEKRSGFYAFVDARFQNHYNAGVLYEQYQSPFDVTKIDCGIKPFIGFNVLEESTVLRLSYECFIPHAVSPVNSVEVQFLFSMGPHKAHMF